MAIMARVFLGEYEVGPDFALIKLVDDPADLIEKIEATEELGRRFSEGAMTARSGGLYSTSWWYGNVPLAVTWLYDAALQDENEEYPEWMEDLDRDNVVQVPDDWEFNAEETFDDYDLTRVTIYPDGTISIEANVDGTSQEFQTHEFDGRSLT